jgi:hypothetical protein
MICYCNKRYNQIAGILNTINSNINWIYVQNNKIKYPNVYPNRAKLFKDINNKLFIEYGDGFSAC